MRSVALLLALFAVLSLAYGAPLLTEVKINSTVLIPEGLEYSNATGFLVSSLSSGQLRAVDSDTGDITTFTSDSDLIATAGLHFGGDVLYVCNALFPPNGTAEFQGGVAAYNTDGDQQWYVDLTDVGNVGLARIINDLVLVGDIVYATESLNGVIYAINSTSLGAEVWSENELYKGLEPLPVLPIGINGIDYFPGSDYLLAVRSGNGNNSALIKIPLDDPANPVSVPIDDGQFLNRCDGARFGSDGDLYVVGNGAPANKVYQVHSGDDFATAAIIGTGDVVNNGPTSLVVRDGTDGVEVYVVTAAEFAVPGDCYIEFVAITPVASTSTGTGSSTATSTGLPNDGGDGSDSSAAAALRGWF